MLTDQAFKNYCRQQEFSRATIDLVQSIRSSPPVRRVDGGRRSVCARYASKKMGMTIQAESLHCELARIYELEYDDDVLEYYDQPLKIKLRFQDKKGQEVSSDHVPDFLVLRKDRVEIEECKPEEQLIKQARRYPNRFTVDDDGAWHCPPGERYFKEFGLHYHVWTQEEANGNIVRNLRFLEAYYRDDDPIIDPYAREEVLRLVSETPGIRLVDLLETIKIADSDTINYLIALEEIFINFETRVLADQHSALIYPDRVMAKSHDICAATSELEYLKLGSEIHLDIGAEILWKHNKYRILHIDEEKLWLSHDTALLKLSMSDFYYLVSSGEITGHQDKTAQCRDEEIQEILLTASPEAHEEALRRYYAIEPTFHGEPADPSIPERTTRRWRASWRSAKEQYGDGYVGLFPRHRDKGNRDVKLTQEVYDIVIRNIEEYYETKKILSAYITHGLISKECKNQELEPPAYQSVCATIRKRSGPDQKRKRWGSKAAYQIEPFLPRFDDSISRHGDRPFEICHIDHTLGDIQLVHSEFRRNLGRPWITTISDGYSRRILSVYISYSKPSFVSCMMALREFVRKWKRLPENIMSDRGKEFESTAYETLLAWYRVNKLSRPASKARFGSTDERINEIINTQFIHSLDGSTQVMKNVREVSPEVDPEKLAIWSLPAFYQRLCDYCYDLYDTKTHSTLGVSPSEKFQLAMKTFGRREQCLIPFDAKFRILSLPSTPRGTVKINRQKGVKVYYIWYRHDAFSHPENAGKNVRVRYDPLNAGVVYIYLNGRWEECNSENDAVFRKRTRQEVMIATEEIKELRRNNNRRYTGVDADNIAKFFKDTVAQEALLKAKLRNSEEKRVQAKIMGGGGGPPLIEMPDPEHQQNTLVLEYKEDSKILSYEEHEPISIPADFEPLPLYEE